MTGHRVVEPELFMARRAILLGLVGMLLPSRAFAQKPSTPPRVGWLSAGSEPDPFLEAFREGLRALDYVEGQNIVLETRAAHQVPAGYQPQDREGAGSDDSPLAAA